MILAIFVYKITAKPKSIATAINRVLDTQAHGPKMYPDLNKKIGLQKLNNWNKHMTIHMWMEYAFLF